MNITRIIFCFLYLSSAAFAQTDSLANESVVVYDTVAVDVRHFDEAKIEELKNDTELQYESGPAAISLWQRFKIWIGRLFNKIFELAATTDWGNILIGAVVLTILIYVILRLLKIDALKVFYSASDKGTTRMSVIEEDIHAMDLEKLLQDAVNKEQYRLAIRLLFLQALKVLSDHHHIQWQPGKTNHDYLNELQQSSLQGGFNELNFYFEYAWYGNFTIQQDLYKKVNSIFSNWKTLVQ